MVFIAITFAFFSGSVAVGSICADAPRGLWVAGLAAVLSGGISVRVWRMERRSHGR